MPGNSLFKKLALILSLLDRREKRQLVLIVFILVVMGFVELAGVGSIGPFISLATNPEIIHSNRYLNAVYTHFQFSGETAFIIAFGIGVIVMLAASNVCLALINAVINIFSGKRVHSISMRFLEKYLRQSYIFYLNINTSDLIRKILGDVPLYTSEVIFSLLQVVSSSIISAFIIVLLICLNPLLALIVSLILGFSYLLIFFLMRKFLEKKGTERNRLNTRKHRYIHEIFGGIKDIKILGKEKIFHDSFFIASKAYAMTDAATTTVNDLPKFILETIAFSGILGFVIMMIHGGTRVEAFLPVLSVYAFGAYRLMPNLQKIFRAVSRIKYYAPIVKELDRDFNGLPPGEPLDDQQTRRLDFRQDLRLENIVFKYPNTHKDTIKKVSLSIPRNTSVAFIGATGCGKTTLVDIILGLLPPDGGKILVDGTEITDTNRRSWQKNLGYVPQSIYLTDDTVRRNIAFGVAEGEADEEAVVRAAKLANIHDFISGELKDGYDTVIGERGIRLSGGQRQRIGIARSVYHDPAVLILDEATSALDSLTENAIMEAITNMSHKKTIIMIAHRITTVKNCDMIYLMEKGSITDQGTYDELFKRNHSFRGMAEGRNT